MHREAPLSHCIPWEATSLVQPSDILIGRTQHELRAQTGHTITTLLYAGLPQLKNLRVVQWQYTHA